MTGSDYWDSVPVGKGGVLDQTEYRRICLSAIGNGDYIAVPIRYDYNGLSFAGMSMPFAIGSFDDYVICFGLSARTVDSIAFALGLVLPTPKIYDIAMHASGPMRVGPHTGDNSGSRGMTKARAKLHSDLIQKQLDGWRGRVIGAGKTYALCNPEAADTYHARHGHASHACEYGWSVKDGGRRGVYQGRIIQAPRYAHTYDFFDYSMGCWLMWPDITIDGRGCDIRDIVVDTNHRHLGRVCHNGAVPYIIHPKSELVRNDYNT